MGVLLGGFYASLSAGLTISLGEVGVVNIAHPTFALLASYLVYLWNVASGIDPILAGVALVLPFFLIGLGLHLSYEKLLGKRSTEDPMMTSMIFYFAVFIILEVLFIIVFGVTEQSVTTSYSTASLFVGPVVLPLRLLYPFVGGLVVVGLLYLLNAKTFIGRAMKAVADDDLALALMGGNPTTVRMIAMGLSVATAAIAGAFLITIQPVYPTVDAELVGLLFAIVIFGGRRSFLGTLVASIILGVATEVAATLVGLAWSIGVSYAVLLAILAFRPSGLFRG